MAETVRVVAILASRNEERFIAGCLEHLFEQNVEAYLVDNDSTDATVSIAQRYLGQGLIGIESFPYAGLYRWQPLLERKEQLAAVLEADWCMHVDPDERHLPPPWAGTLAEAFAKVEAKGFNAVNFLEFTFIPTQEAPDHDHPDFQKTMRWYYPFAPTAGFLMRAWKRQPERVGLAASGGHRVQFQGLRMYPEPFRMRHYHFLSVGHAVSKLVGRPYDPAEIARGWHGWRARLTPDMIRLPKAAELRQCGSDGELDASNPRLEHYLAELVRLSGTAGDTVPRS